MFKFKFDGVLDKDSTQEDVFDTVARGPVDNALSGFNATIFAYGQTGSGKTYTITGGAEKYRDRGIIPRTLSYMFEAFSKRSAETQFTAYVSFMEIYNGRGYDLLDPAHESKGAENMVPRVSMFEDQDGNVHLRNLSMHGVRSEEEALNLLFLGDTNRAISETAMNTNSSRSHCIFTITLEARPVGSETIRRSKLHLVDLAGSERVHKTGSVGQTLKEAGCINVSLMHLQMVIIALHERSKGDRTHIPYRNSMMTAMLRDSLGGNCKTSMIATMSPEDGQTNESISTCRFAQRVARVSNVAIVNEEVDPTLVIKRLKNEVRLLKEQVAFLKSNRRGSDENDGDDDGDDEKELTTTERNHLRRRLEAFVDDRNMNARLTLGSGNGSGGAMSFKRVQTAFMLLKEMVVKGGGHITRREDDEEDDKEKSSTQYLKNELRKRDHEIKRLKSLLRNGEKYLENDDADDDDKKEINESKVRSPRRRPRPRATDPRAVPAPKDISILEDKKRAFEYFRQRHERNGGMEECKSELKRKYEEAKATGRDVNRARSRINHLKKSIEKIRLEYAMSCGNALPDDYEPGDTERDMIEEMNCEKTTYKTKFQRLKVMKKEIQHTQKMIEKSRKILVKEFETWLQNVKCERDVVVSRRRRSEEDELASGGSKNITPRSTSSRDDGDRRGRRGQRERSRNESGEKKSSWHTGDDHVDDDIAAFNAAKRELMSRFSATLNSRGK